MSFSTHISAYHWIGSNRFCVREEWNRQTGWYLRIIPEYIRSDTLCTLIIWCFGFENIGLQEAISTRIAFHRELPIHSGNSNKVKRKGNQHLFKKAASERLYGRFMLPQRGGSVFIESQLLLFRFDRVVLVAPTSGERSVRERRNDNRTEYDTELSE